MAHGVLAQDLHGEEGHPRALQRRVPLELDLQPLAEADPAQLKVVLAEVQLPGQRDQRLLRLLQHSPQQLAQPHHAALGLHGLLAAELGHQVEGVEQKVWVESGLQRAEAGLLQGVAQHQGARVLHLQLPLQLQVS